MSLVLLGTWHINDARIVWVQADGCEVLGWSGVRHGNPQPLPVGGN